MRDKILELGVDVGLGDGWVSVSCPFCPDGRGRSILAIKKCVGYYMSNCWSTSCPAHGHKRWDVDNVSKEDLEYGLSERTNTKLATNVPHCDYTRYIPDHFVHYLNKYCIIRQLMRKYRIGYSYELDRLIIPTQDGYLARSLSEQPKWKNYTDTPFVCGESVGGGTLYIVEDPISAIRLGEYTPTLSLLGTNLQLIHLTEALKYGRVVLWLDPDKAGLGGALKIKCKLGVHVDTRIMQGVDKEAKEMSNFELKEQIRVIKL